VPDRERQRITIAKSDLPVGARCVVHAGRREIAVFNVDGNLHALFNRCPHHQAPLHLGSIGGTNVPASEVGEFEYGMEGKILRCPWHRYEFNLDTGTCLVEMRRLRVATYEVREEGDEIAVYV
jgi:nitrite reductase (NADH) small subunit